MPTSTAKLFLSLIRNARSDKMNRAMIDYTVEQRFPPITKDAIAEFAWATCDDNPVYTTLQAPAPPFFIGKLIIPLIRHIWAHRALNLNLLKTVQISHSAIWLAPIQQGHEVAIRCKIQNIFTEPRGEILELQGTALVKDQVVAEGTFGFLVKSKNGRRERAALENPGSEAFRLSLHIPEGQQLMYANASGDNNFIHTSPLLARIAGLPRTVMQGACVLAMVCSALTRHLVDNNIMRLASLSGQFGKPVFPGETLTVIGYQSIDRNSVPFAVLNAQRKSVFRQGDLRVVQ